MMQFLVPYNGINWLFLSLLNFFHRFVLCWGRGLLLLFYIAGPAYAHPTVDSRLLDVTIVLSEQSGSYAEFSNILDKFLTGKNIPHRVIDTTQPIPIGGVIIGVGMKAATAVSSSEASSVLNVLISRSSYEKLLQDFPRRIGSHTFSAIYLDQPIERQIELISAALPHKHNIGILYSTPPKELVHIRQEMKDHGLILHEQTVGSEFSLFEALQVSLSSNETLLALPDATVYNDSTVRNILLATYRSGIPLIGVSPGYVTAGALCAVFSTPEQIAIQTATLILQFEDSHALPAAQYPREFDVMVNEKVARSLGLQLKQASALHDEIRSHIEVNQ
jgi:hypothetical protein